MCRDGSHALNQRWMRVVVSGPDATHTVSGSGGTLVSACLVGKLVSKPQPMRNADQRGSGLIFDLLADEILTRADGYAHAHGMSQSFHGTTHFRGLTVGNHSCYCAGPCCTPPEDKESARFCSTANRSAW